MTAQSSRLGQELPPAGAARSRSCCRRRVCCWNRSGCRNGMSLLQVLLWRLLLRQTQELQETGEGEMLEQGLPRGSGAAEARRSS